MLQQGAEELITGLCTDVRSWFSLHLPVSPLNSHSFLKGIWRLQLINCLRIAVLTRQMLHLYWWDQGLKYSLEAIQLWNPYDESILLLLCCLPREDVLFKHLVIFYWLKLINSLLWYLQKQNRVIVKCFGSIRSLDTANVPEINYFKEQLSMKLCVHKPKSMQVSL